jgi:uncharacterized protein
MGSYLADAWSLSPTLGMVLAGIFLLGAAVGHIALLVRGHNFLYSLPIDRHVTDGLHLLFGGLAVAGPVVFLLAGPDLFPLLLGAGISPARRALGIYAAGCCLIGAVFLPAITLARWRRCPALVSNHTERVDVAARLGYRPIGNGKFRWLAHLPRNELFRLNVVERALLLPRLPAEWEGLTILHLTDLHLHGTPDLPYFEQVFDLCAAREPDLVALTGDLTDSVPHQKWLGPLLGRLKYREEALGILGNHDRWYNPEGARETLRRAGLRVLTNRWETLELRGLPLVVIGHEGPWEGPAPDLSGCPEGPFRLCLSHTPDNLPWARRHGIDLMLSGHVHGGQIRFPLLGSLLVPSRYGRRYDWGVFEEAPTVLHVSCGLSGKQPIRYGCPPEVVWLVLRRAEKD